MVRLFFHFTGGLAALWSAVAIGSVCDPHLVWLAGRVIASAIGLGG